jgi:hypothetical protein
VKSRRRARAPEGRAHLVVASAARDRIRAARGERGEHEPALVIESAQLRQVHGNLHARRGHQAREAIEGIQRRRDRGKRGQRLACRSDHLARPVHRGECRHRITAQRLRARRVLLLHGMEERFGILGAQPRFLRERAIDSRMAQIDVHPFDGLRA